MLKIIISSESVDGKKHIRQKFHTAKTPYGEFFMRRRLRKAKSVRRNFLRRNFQEAMYTTLASFTSSYLVLPLFLLRLTISYKVSLYSFFHPPISESCIPLLKLMSEQIQNIPIKSITNIFSQNNAAPHSVNTYFPERPACE